MNCSIFDSFVGIDEGKGAVTMVYAKRKYYLCVELMKFEENLTRKQIAIIFYDDSLSSAPPFIRHCCYQNLFQNRIKIGIIGCAESTLCIREWRELTNAISSTWPVSMSDLSEWYKGIEISAQESEGTVDVFKLVMFNIYKTGSFCSANYLWVKYKLSQLQINAFSLGM